jgi:hypothetical protein
MPTGMLISYPPFRAHNSLFVFFFYDRDGLCLCKRKRDGQACVMQEREREREREREMADTQTWWGQNNGTPSWKMPSAWILKRLQRGCEPFSSQFGYGQKVGGFSIIVESGTTKAGNLLTSWVAIRYSWRTSPHIQIGPTIVRELSLLKDTEGYQVTPWASDEHWRNEAETTAAYQGHQIRAAGRCLLTSLFCSTFK